MFDLTIKDGSESKRHKIDKSIIQFAKKFNAWMKYKIDRENTRFENYMESKSPLSNL